MVKEIKLSKGNKVFVDDDMYEYLNQWKWYSDKGYATRSIKYKDENGKQIKKNIYMHRIINNTPDGYDTDHIDGNIENNSKSNLRNVTKSQNQMNCLTNNGSSRYKGVSYRSDLKKWRAYITINGTFKHLGVFETEEKAKEAYNVSAIENFKEFARINN